MVSEFQKEIIEEGTRTKQLAAQMSSLQARLETTEIGLHQAQDGLIKNQEGMSRNQEVIQSLEKKLDASMDGLAKKFRQILKYVLKAATG